MEDQIGETAGKIYEFLESNGKTRLTELEKKVTADKQTIKMAVGWLAREGKLDFEKVKKSTFLSLR